MEKTTLTRVFQYSGIKLPDPDNTMSPIGVRDFFAMAGRPELSSAEVRGPEVVGNELVYTLHRAVGTKGSDAETLVTNEVRDAMNRFTPEKIVINQTVNKALSNRSREQEKPITPPGELIPWFF